MTCIGRSLASNSPGYRRFPLKYGLERLMRHLYCASNLRAETSRYLGITTMSAPSIDSLGHCASRKRMRRWARLSVLALSTVIAVSICILPARTTFADQVLELPQAVAPASYRDASAADGAAEPPPRRQAMAPMPSGLGSLDDYERQGESDRPAGLASGPSNVRIDPNGNREALANDIILGALVIGLFALEMHAAHQNRHR